VVVFTVLGLVFVLLCSVSFTFQLVLISIQLKLVTLQILEAFERVLGAVRPSLIIVRVQSVAEGRRMVILKIYNVMLMGSPLQRYAEVVSGGPLDLMRAIRCEMPREQPDSLMLKIYGVEASYCRSS